MMAPWALPTRRKQMMMPLDLGIFGARGIPPPAPGSYLDIDLYTGNGGASRSVASLDLSAGGVVWVKSRNQSQAAFFSMWDGGGGAVRHGTVDSSLALSSGGIDYTAAGFEYNNADNDVNARTYCATAYRKVPRFLDIVRYTGNGAARQIPHALGIRPGLMVVKAEGGGSLSWEIYWRGAGALVRCSWAAGETATDDWNDTEPTDTEFSIGAPLPVNTNGVNYVAVLFGHDEAADGVIYAGTYVGAGASAGPSQILPFGQPSLVLIDSGGTNFTQFDTTRSPGFTGNDARLTVGASIAESATVNDVELVTGGFRGAANSVVANASGINYRYLAIK